MTAFSLADRRGERAGGEGRSRAALPDDRPGRIVTAGHGLGAGPGGHRGWPRRTSGAPIGKAGLADVPSLRRCRRRPRVPGLRPRPLGRPRGGADRAADRCGDAEIARGERPRPRGRDPLRDPPGRDHAARSAPSSWRGVGRAGRGVGYRAEMTPPPTGSSPGSAQPYFDGRFDLSDASVNG